MKTPHAPHISVVSPVYGCAAALPVLCKRLHDVLGSITADYEIILVNDASPDTSWIDIQELAVADARVKGINLSRNFGQHYAITAGLDFAMGDWVVVMDCDLQDQPEEIPKLYSAALNGYDMAVGRRVERKDSFFKKLASTSFYRAYDYFTGTTIDNSIANFGIYSKDVIKSIRSMREQNRSFGLFAIWVGFNRIEIDIDHRPRIVGKSSYTVRKMIQLALDSIVAHSNKLLWLTIKLSFIIVFVSLLFALWLIVKYFMNGAPLMGWTSIMVSIFFTSGLVIGTIGIVGLYVGKIFDEVKSRPLYIVSSITWREEDALINKKSNIVI